MLELRVLQWGTFIISLPELLCWGGAIYFSRRSEKEIPELLLQILTLGHCFISLPAKSLPLTTLFLERVCRTSSHGVLESAIFSERSSISLWRSLEEVISLSIATSTSFSYVVLYLSFSSYTATLAFSCFMYFSQSLGGLLLYCFLGLRSFSPIFIWDDIFISLYLYQLQSFSLIDCVVIVLLGYVA